MLSSKTSEIIRVLARAAGAGTSRARQGEATARAAMERLDMRTEQAMGVRFPVTRGPPGRACGSKVAIGHCRSAGNRPLPSRAMLLPRTAPARGRLTALVAVAAALVCSG